MLNFIEQNPEILLIIVSFTLLIIGSIVLCGYCFRKSVNEENKSINRKDYSLYQI